MQVERYKHPSPTMAHLPGSCRTVGIRPLTISQTQQVDSLALQLIDHFEGTVAVRVASLHVKVGVLAHALCEPLPPHRPLASSRRLAAALIPDECTALFSKWLDVQRDSLPDVAKLSAYITMQLPNNCALAVEAAAASSGTVGDLFGRHLGDLTMGQIAYFIALRSAYDRLHGQSGAGGTRAISRTALERASS